MPAVYVIIDQVPPRGVVEVRMITVRMKFSSLRHPVQFDVDDRVRLIRFKSGTSTRLLEGTAMTLALHSVLGRSRS